MKEQTLARFIYEPNMKMPAAVLLLMLSYSSPDQIARWDDVRKEYVYESKSSVYYNGREDGFVLQVSNSIAGDVICIYVSESRNSDQIFVETWKDSGFGINPPAIARPETAYKGRTYFGEGEYEKALDFIKNAIRAHLAECYKIADERKKAKALA